MKHNAGYLLVALLLIAASLRSQTLTRLAIETPEALIDRVSATDSVFGVHREFMYEGYTALLYFRVVMPVYGKPQTPQQQLAHTIAELLLSADGVHYTNYSLDTLASESSCFAPAFPDSVFLRNIDADPQPEIGLVLRVDPYCDAYLSMTSILFLDDAASLVHAQTATRPAQFNQQLFLLPPPRPGQWRLAIEANLAKRHPLLPPVQRDDLKFLYDSIGLQGCFVLYDPQLQQYTYVNQSMATWQLTPASTFKICNTLIGLETGAAKDEQQVFQWNGKKHSNPNWNKTQNLMEAYKNSTVWYYQELARRIGKERMKMWLDSCGYGNADTTGGLTQFWLTGKLRITAEQQTEFLQRLHEDKLPFSHQTMGTTKEIMINEMIGDFTLYGKTGWGYTDSLLMTGWYVGYVEVGNKVYYFANLLTTSTDYNNPHFGAARKAIAYRMLREMGVLPPTN